MEYVAGEDLDQRVRRAGALPPAETCHLICQIASALEEAHRHDLIHRDIKPSNILVTPEGQAKLLDFGLARQYHDRRITQPGTVIGSLDYMAPEQAGADAGVDHRADIYALGGTLYWCLTGKAPFPPRTTLAEEIAARQTQQPPSLRRLRPDLPVELDAVLARMMALRPEDRYPTSQGVMSALLPFLGEQKAAGAASRTTMIVPGPAARASRVHQVLIADDSNTSRMFCRLALDHESIACDEAANGKRALEAVRAKAYDLVLLDINMPEMTGPEVLRELRDRPPGPNLKVIMLSGGVSPDEMAELLAAGADDYLPKPPSIPQLVGRVKAALALKDAQDRSDMLNRHLLAVNAELERSLRASCGDMAQSRNALLLSLAELAELRAGKSAVHQVRLQRYCRCLAEEAAGLLAFAGQIDANFIDMLECCAPLHDIGQAALPDHILRKAGKFDLEERLIMQSHTTLGADILQGIARRHRSALALLQMAADIARHHHEAYDGTGYPDRLAGNAIPLAARIVALADVYDALRSSRSHRPALSHLLAVELMNTGSPGRFDPLLLEVFRALRPAVRSDRARRGLVVTGGEPPATAEASGRRRGPLEEPRVEVHLLLGALRRAEQDGQRMAGVAHLVLGADQGGVGLSGNAAAQHQDERPDGDAQRCPTPSGPVTTSTAPEPPPAHSRRARNSACAAALASSCARSRNARSSAPRHSRRSHGKERGRRITNVRRLGGMRIPSADDPACSPSTRRNEPMVSRPPQPRSLTPPPRGL